MSKCSVQLGIRVLSRNGFLWRKMVRGKCTLGRVWGLPPRKMLVCLYPSTSICQFLLTGKGLLYAIVLNCNLKKKWGGEAWVFGGEASPAPTPSRLNPGNRNPETTVAVSARKASFDVGTEWHKMEVVWMSVRSVALRQCRSQQSGQCG